MSAAQIWSLLTSADQVCYQTKITIQKENSFKNLELQRIYNVLVPSHFHLGEKCPLSVDLYLTNSYYCFCILNLGVNLQEQMRFYMNNSG